MTSKIFKIGDVVTLKSGGSKMTIDEIKQQYDNGKPLEGFECKCVWIDKDGKPNQVTYDELSLIIFTPPKGRQFKGIHIG